MGRRLHHHRTLHSPQTVHTPPPPPQVCRPVVVKSSSSVTESKSCSTHDRDRDWNRALGFWETGIMSCRQSRFARPHLLSPLHQRKPKSPLQRATSHEGARRLGMRVERLSEIVSTHLDAIF